MGADPRKQESYQRTVALVLAVVLIFLTYLIVRPFMVAILSAAALAYIFNPIHVYLRDRMLSRFSLRKTAAALITCLAIILLVLIPAITVTTIVGYQLREGYGFFRIFLNSPEISTLKLPDGLVQLVGGKAEVMNLVSDLVGQVVGWLQDVMKGIPNMMLNIFITVFSTYYFLKHGMDIYEFMQTLFPLPGNRYRQMVERFNDLSRSIIMGQFLIGLLQGVLTWAGFLMLGVPNPALWGFLTALISVIPLLGAALVWVPVDIYLFLPLTSPGIIFLRWRCCYTARSWSARSIISSSRRSWAAMPMSTRSSFCSASSAGSSFSASRGSWIGPLILTLFDLGIEIYRESL